MELYLSEKISSKNVLEFLNAQAKEAGTKIHAFQLYKGNELMIRLSPEPYSNTYKRQMYSVSKTFTSTAIGIAYDMGIVKPSDKLCDIFKDELLSNENEYIKKLTVHNLLTMSAGHRDCTMKAISCSDNGIKAFFEREFIYEPGTKYVYDTGATYMLSAVLTKLTSLSMLDFLNLHLFRYMGIENIKWPYAGGKINEGGIGINASADDLTKLGLLYLNKGVWNGKRLLSEEWIKEATTGYLPGDESRVPNWKSGYAYQIWINEKGGYRADGAFGQYCIVVPEKDIVITILVGHANVERELELCFEYMDKFFENPDNDTTELEKYLKSLYKPYSSEKISVDKKLYRVNPNLNKVTFVTTENTGDTYTLIFSDGEKPKKITAGNGYYIENEIRLRAFRPQLYGLMSDAFEEDCRFLASFSSNGETTEIEMKYLNCPHVVVAHINEKDKKISFNITSDTDTLPQKPFSFDGNLI
ncbi:MAG: serine hydrolase [Clostridia bacterium]|nr:serine hydrolase [Clostridia bacterium]